ncbi:hypothetical protein D9757_007225 [Collybiopsis confluens]|uniref:WD40 repeat-like protein n=1 Tax=Collybiopsis confluens TaxID=2823264 RepID=A0A8H5HAV3_9AGAR|nr:hypothetical protein D9757_007225 [Collybiopsis confluens]
MDDSFAAPGEGIQLSSVLGVKGSLRFCHHTSTAKAHVVLRRVALSDDTSDDEEGKPPSSAVHFRLFAQKRFTITPGKEILLTVEDARFKDRPVLLTGTVSSEDSSELVERIEDGDIPPLPKKALPPKMRRAWVKKPEETTTTEKTSIGVQATPHLSSAHVQVRPFLQNVSVQTQPSLATAFVQTHSSASSISTQTECSQRVPRIDTSHQLTKAEEQSLSPMDLDSPIESGVSSFVNTNPITPPSLSDKLSSSKLDLSDDEQEMQISPSPTPPIQDVEVSQELDIPAAVVNSAFTRPTLSSDSAVDPSKALETLYRRSAVHNPFVSGGIVSDFMGDVNALKFLADKIDRPKQDDSAGKSADTTGLYSVKVRMVKKIPFPFFLSFPVSQLLQFTANHNQSLGKYIASTSKTGLNANFILNSSTELTGTLQERYGPKAKSVASLHPILPKITPTGPRNTASAPNMVNAPRAPRSLRIKEEDATPSLSLKPLAPTYSNPLGIRPSDLAPSGPKALAGANTKKKLVIGAGTLSKASTRKRRDANASHLVSYSSPPPPNTPPQPSPTKSSRPLPPPAIQIKWKRLSAIDPSTNLGTISNDSQFPPADTKVNSIIHEEQESPSRVELFQKLPNFRKHPNSFYVYFTISSNFASLAISASSASLAYPYSPRKGPLSINASRIPPVAMPFLNDSPTSHQFVHPLPPKPPPVRGIKRERPPTPPFSDYTVDTMRRPKRAFRWPTLESNHSIFLRGEGDLSIVGISGNSDGSLLALNCADRTIRIWDNQARAEMARLSHNARIANVLWLDNDAGVVSLGEDGIVSKWARTGWNMWEWTKLVEIGDKGLASNSQGSGMRLAYHRDRIAVSLPAEGIKIWFWVKGTWQAQRSILRSNTTALTFIDDGSTLLGGTIDGVLWSCEVPNGTLRAWSFLKTKILSIDINTARTHALITCPGVCRLVGLRDDRKGKLEQSFSNKETESQQRSFGALFTAQGQGVLFGDIKGCTLIWDTKKGAPVYGLDHGEGDWDRGEDEEVTAAASLEASDGGCIVTGTKTGLLSWWSQPAYTNSGRLQ